MRITFKKEKGSRALGYVFLTIILAFFILSILTLLFPVIGVDITFTKVVQALKSPAFTAFMHGTSVFAETTVIIVTTLGLTAVFYLMQYKREAVFMFLTSIGTIMGFVLKYLLGRPRPTSDLVELFKEAGYFSFPSVHVQHYTIFFGYLFVMMFIMKRIPKWIRYSTQGVCLFLIFIISFSRIYLGVHWLTDVIGGYLLGLIYLLVLLHFYFKPKYALDNAD